MKFPSLPLKDGNSIPLIGFGTGTAWYKEGPEEPLNRDLVDILKAAIERGFRHIDASDAYGTEEEVGIAIKKCGILRKEIFGLYDIPISIQSSLTKLQLDYVDLYLLHSPYLARKSSDLQPIWLSMEQVKASGKAKSIGVSNHQCSHIEVLLNVAIIIPVLNQLEFHPYLQRAYDYLPWMRAHGIEVASFNGLTPITKARSGPLDNILVEISARHQIPKNAVLISWQIAQNVVVTTTTTKVGRLEDCAAAVQLKLSREEQEKIT
ncbi:putative aldehyde reductase 1 protein [Botrytis fragariae]|uniref:Putative aldehyde reductase 1 protein n=1 Tax=Botrytis fragariae TaxID=1964551 RepID=A0A8H6B2E3_9HELO|nr:putative aldehyde reductase 1 protein [Botrytis fragariae]KAF5877903.1 putative aldehyde reductase 1 protein [Botrytis fragariae]